MPEQKQNLQYQQQLEGNYQTGLALAVGLHTIFAMVIVWIAYIKNDWSSMIWLLFIGLTQLIYIIPAMVITHFTGKPHLVRGLLIGASITFLLNAGCAGLMIIFN